MTRSPLALLLTALLTTSTLLAGCLQGAEDAPVQPGTTTADATNTTLVKPAEVTTLDGAITVGVGAAGQYLVPTTAVDKRTLEVEVGKNATALVLEMAWATKAMDLDLQLVTPSEDVQWHTTGSPGSGDSPFKLILEGEDLETGTYTLRAWAKNSVNEKIKLAGTVFYGEPVAEDYTALK